jgi:riboflavin kinase/FMN adenylyltransferase
MDFSRLSADTFVHDVLVEHLNTARIVVGENLRFGHRAAGDIALLTRLGRSFGFVVESMPLVCTDDIAFSSTYIRSCVHGGDVAAAALALGRPHRIEGVVIRGDQIGRTLGYPTANLLCPPYTAVPADGIYAGWVAYRGQRHMAAMSIGANPTFAAPQRRIEAYLLDFDGDLYGDHLAFDFVTRLREMRTYDDVAPLITQITQDVADTRALLS